MKFKKETLILPRVLDSCPIIESVCEVRFEPKLPPDAVFGAAYAKLAPFAGTQTQLPILALPPAVYESDINLRFQPHYKFEQNGIVMQLGPRVIAVAETGPYRGWQNFFTAVNERIKALVSSGVVSKMTRFGLRYINFFESDIFNSIELEMRINGQQVDAGETSLSFVVKDRYSHIIRIRKDVTVVVAGPPARFGSIIDIDSFTDCPEGDLAAFNTFMEQAHLDEKALFFGLLKSEFLNTLKPQY